MAVDWKKMVKEQAMPGQKLPELSEIADLLPQTVKIEAAEPAMESPVKSDWRLMVLIVAVFSLVIVLKRFWTWRK
jgi:hypothetical protein